VTGPRRFGPVEGERKIEASILGVSLPPFSVASALEAVGNGLVKDMERDGGPGYFRFPSRRVPSA
jgi:hypothetical protein